MNVLITEVIWSEGIRALEEEGHKVHYDETLWKKEEKLISEIGNYDAVIIRNQTQVNETLLSAAGDRLKVVGRLGVGLDNIDIQATRDYGVEVVYARNANATSVAEYVISAVLSANRSLDQANVDVKNGEWNRRKHTGSEIFNKSIGLIGLGEIAHRVAKRANAFGMKVVGYDPFITDYDHVVSETGVIVKKRLSDLLSEADFISVHVPFNSSTRHLISYNEFQDMKRKAFIINTSRGGIIDEEALCQAVHENRIGGAYLDVIEKEPIQHDNMLLNYENITLTPHIAGLTEESQIRTSLLVAKEVSKVLQGSKSLCAI